MNNPDIYKESELFSFYPNKCENKIIQLNITLEDSYNGSKKGVEYDRNIICPECKGTG